MLNFSKHQLVINEWLVAFHFLAAVGWLNFPNPLNFQHGQFHKQASMNRSGDALSAKQMVNRGKSRDNLLDQSRQSVENVK